MITAASAVAVVVAAGAIAWIECVPMIVWALDGGWIAAHLGRRLPAPMIRSLTLAVATLTTVIFLARDNS